MRKLTFLAAMFMLTNFAFAGGLLTNTNQSAQFIRMMSRNASLDIDAVYYNPAGLTKLQDGWHFGVYSQTIFQDKTVECGFPLLNEPSYLGTVEVPVFPTAFAVYKKEKWAFSFGFGPNAGGGSAEFERGLPSFEIPISTFSAGLKQLAPLMSINQLPSATGYDVNMSFDGSSIFWGFQLGATYEINEMISLYGGVRILPSKNTYYGEINDIMINTSTGNMKGSEYQQLVAPVLTGTIGLLNTSSTGLQAAITAGLIDPNAPVSNPLVSQVLLLLGKPGATNQEAVGILAQSAGSMEKLKNADVSNKKVDVTQNGTGFTPIIGINFSPNEDWNIGIKYEHKTKLTLTNNTTVDDLGLFPNDAESASDVPAILGIGVGYKGMDWLEAQVSYTQYFNKSVDWGMNVRDASSWKSVDPSKIRKREIEKNGYEIGLGLQFNLSEKFAVSVGGLMGDMGVAPSYQSDFSYSNPSTTLGGGIMWKLSEKLTLDAGISNTFYEDQTVNFADPVVPSYNDVYGKTALTFAAGLSYSIF
jgi:long-chain fatty acid transport protein